MLLLTVLTRNSSMNLETPWYLYVLEYPSEWSAPGWSDYPYAQLYSENSELELCEATNPSLTVSRVWHEKNLW